MNARHRTPSADVTRSILASAALLLEHEGPDALTVRRIAAAAEVAPMSVYNHFVSKAGVIDALFQEGFLRLSTALEGANHVPDPELALRAGLDLYRRLALDHPASYRLMFMKTVPGFEPSQEAMDVAGAAFDQLVRAVEHLMVDGRFTSGDSREIAQRIWASCHGWISLEMFGIGFIDNTSAGYDALVDLLIVGLRPLG